MNTQIQGGGKNSGVYANTGSSAKLVEYLKHEDAERLAKGLEILPFFNAMGIEVSDKEVIQKLDRNHKKLHFDEAKFFHLDLNPSQSELRAMGDTEEEIIAGCKKYALAMSQAYAENFHKEIVIGKDSEGNPVKRPLSAEDLMLFWKIHINRQEKEGLQVHIHGVPSRKDIHNRIQLSPKTNHRTTTKGAVIGGFERTAYYRTAEAVFDKMFGYDRPVTETFEYYLAQKRGEELKAEQKTLLTSEIEKKEMSHRKDVLLSRTTRVEVERKAAEIRPESSTKIQDALARREQRRRREVLEDYRSKYEPLCDDLISLCDRAAGLYSSAIELDDNISSEIADKKALLDATREVLKDKSRNIQEPAEKCTKEIVTGISSMLLAANPVAGVIVALVCSVLKDLEKGADSLEQTNIRKEALSLRSDIEDLRSRQASLKKDEEHSLNIYSENKEILDQLQAGLDELNTLAEKPDNPRTLKDFLRGYDRFLSEKEAKAGETQKMPSMVSDKLYAYSRKQEILDVFKTSRSRESLDLNLACLGMSYREVRGKYGVEDITITQGGGKTFSVDLSAFGQEYLHEILKGYQEATSIKPAYKIMESYRYAETVRQAQQANRCRHQIILQNKEKAAQQSQSSPDINTNEETMKHGRRR